METDMPAWKEQLDRVERYLSRIQQLDRPRDDYEDDLWSFFQNCWHLKDWIINDKTAGVQANIVETEINSDSFPALKICADLANRSKHLELKNKRVDANIHGDIAVAIGESLSGSESSSAISYDYTVVFPDGSERPAIDVARQAVIDWTNLLKRYKLL